MIYVNTNNSTGGTRKLSKNMDRMVECPFYIAESKKSIICEGIVDNSQCVHKFTDDLKKIFHEMNYCCCSGGRKCLHYRQVALLYERGLKH